MMHQAPWPSLECLPLPWARPPGIQQASSSAVGLLSESLKKFHRFCSPWRIGCPLLTMPATFCVPSPEYKMKKESSRTAGPPHWVLASSLSLGPFSTQTCYCPQPGRGAMLLLCQFCISLCAIVFNTCFTAPSVRAPKQWAQNQ